MPKKTTSKAKDIQQRNKQAQWQRRAAAQGGVVIPATTETSDGDVESVSTAGAVRGGVARTAVQPRTRATSAGATSGAAARRANASNALRGSARLRMAATQMSLDDEMSYVRSDIRRLVILTALCMAVLIMLAFVIR